MMAASALMILALAAPAQESAPPEGEAARLLIFLAEDRPIFLRLRVTSQGRPLRSLVVLPCRNPSTTGIY